MRTLEPGDDGYDDARRVWNAMVDRRPRYIVACSSAEEVAEAIRFARANDLEIGVRCGGHSIVGHAVPDDGLMIDLRPMGSVEVDASARLARVQGGALLGALDRAAQAHGLATTAGNVSHTGIGWLALGGGMGWLARQHGLTCDNVVSFEVVTAEGEILDVDRDHHRELFWALRGGGGNFGVVTEFELVLHPEPGDALSVEYLYPVASGTAAMRRWRDESTRADRRATYNATISDGTLSLGFVWVGDPVDGEAAATMLATSLAEVDAGFERVIVRMTYLELQTREDDIEAHEWRRYWKGHYFSELSDDVIDAVLARDGDDLPNVSLQAYGGAIADVAPGETAFSRRDTAFEFVCASKWVDSVEDERRIWAARRYAAAMEPFASGAYVNALSGEGSAGMRRAYAPEHLARLSAVKNSYDPANIFQLNQNIVPSGRDPNR